MNKLCRGIMFCGVLFLLISQPSEVMAELTIPQEVTYLSIRRYQPRKSKHNDRIEMCRRRTGSDEAENYDNAAIESTEIQEKNFTEEGGDPLSTLTCVNTLGGRAFGNTGDTTIELDLSEDITGDSGIKGSEIIAYAFQYVGNAYVWGGVSLTDGCDCSGYIMAVMEHFGIYFPHYSYDAVNYGISVSAEDVKLGDVMIYNGGGHVAFYMGNGLILEAEGSEWGIVAGSREAFYQWDGSAKECQIRRYI